MVAMSWGVLALVLMAALRTSRAKNIALSKHQIHQHLAWFDTKDKHSTAEDRHLGPHSSAWQLWKQSFETVTSDTEGILHVSQINDLFKEHYNLHHKQHIDNVDLEQFRLANSAHFVEEAIQFRAWLPADASHRYTYEEFHDKMLEFMDSRHDERKGLIEYAQHIYRAEL